MGENIPWLGTEAAAGITSVATRTWPQVLIASNVLLLNSAHMTALEFLHESLHNEHQKCMFSVYLCVSIFSFATRVW